LSEGRAAVTAIQTVIDGLRMVHSPLARHGGRMAAGLPVVKFVFGASPKAPDEIDRD
jgi:hypothetical protein